MLRGSVTWISFSPVLFNSTQNPKPSPTHKLKIGLAKHAVVATVVGENDLSTRSRKPRCGKRYEDKNSLVDSPFFDMVTLATRSWRELPNASTVRPNTVVGISRRMPNNVNRSTSLSAIASSHVADIAKPYNVSGTFWGS